MKNYKKITAVGLAVVMSLSLAACGKSAGDTTTQSSGTTDNTVTQGAAGTASENELVTATNDTKSADNDLVIAIEGSVSGLDPHNVSDTNAISATRGMYETLVTFDEKQELTGLLAESWDVSEDSLTYTFYLRQGVKFHDGTDFNAAAVVANYDRVLNKDNGLSRRRSFVVTGSDGTETPRVKSIETPDDYTVIFTLAKPYSVFINKMTQFNIISPAAIEKYGKDLLNNPCGTGPFLFKEWMEGDHTTMVKNDNYWGTAPSVASVTIKEVPEAGSRTAMLQTGEADFVYPMPSDQIAAIQGNGDINVKSDTSNIMRYVTLNMDLKELSDVKVRQAMNYAIDKNAYIQLMYSGYGLPATSVIPSCINYYKEQTPYTYDLDKAKALLKEAGYENGFSLTLWGDNTTQEIKGMTFVKQQLEQIGIKVDVQAMEPATVSDKIYVDKDEAEINMWYVNWSASDRSTDSSVRALLYSDMCPPTSANTAYYNSPEFDSLLDQGLAAAEPAQLTDIYAKMQETAWNDAPWLFLGNDKIIYATKSYLSNVSVLPDGALNYNNAVLAQ